MMKRYIYIIFILFLVACSSEKKVSLFNDLYYELSDNEKVLQTADVKNDYESFVNTKQVKIPLFKCIATNQYRVFIGLPYEMSFSDLNTNFVKDGILLEERNTETSIYKKYKREETFIMEYVVKKAQNLLVIFCVSKDESAVTKEELESKIKNNEK